MKSAENNCGEGRNGSALRPHTRHEKRLSNNSNLGSLFFMFANNITISRYL